MDKRKSSTSSPYVLHISEPKGCIWSKKPRVMPDGLVSVFQIDQPGATQFVASTLNESGDRLASVDSRGRVFVFSISSNRFAQISRASCAGTAIMYPTASRGPRPHRDLYVGFEDGVIRCFNTDSGKVDATLRGHSSAVCRLASHPGGGRLLSVASDSVTVWSLHDFSKVRSMGGDAVSFRDAVFLPQGHIATLSSSDKISIWDGVSFSCIDSLSLPKNMAELCQRPCRGDEDAIPHPSFRLHRLCITSSGKHLVSGGKLTANLYVWTLGQIGSNGDGGSHRAKQPPLKVIELPYPASQILGLFTCPNVPSLVAALCDDGSVRFVDVEVAKLKFEIPGMHGEKRVAIGGVDGKEARRWNGRKRHVAFDGAGRYAAAVLRTGQICVYDLAIRSMLKVKSPHPLRSPKQSHAKLDPIAGRALASPPHPEDGNESVSSSPRPKPTPAPQRTRSSHVNRSWEVENGEAASVLGSASELNRVKLQALLRAHGSLPEKYRLMVWEWLLALPRCVEAFQALQRRGVHPAFSDIPQRYPLADSTLLRRLTRLVSCLAHWSDVCAESSFLPALAFPFAKLFGRDEIGAFEVVATVILNWGQGWFEFFPHPPIAVLSSIEDILSRHDAQVHTRLAEIGLDASMYAWPLLSTVFTEVLPRDDWLRLWDHALLHHPAFLYYAVVAYVRIFRSTFLCATHAEEVKRFFHRDNSVSMDTLLRLANQMWESDGIPQQAARQHQELTGEGDLDPSESVHRSSIVEGGWGQCDRTWGLEAFRPMARGLAYPIPTKYPKFVVNCQMRERERIQRDEAELARRRRLLGHLEKQIDSLAMQEAEYRDRVQKLREAEQKRKEAHAEEEKRRARTRKEVEQRIAEQRLRHVRAMEQSCQSFYEQHGDQVEVELSRLDADLRRIKEYEEDVIKRRKEEQALLELEWKAYRRLEAMERDRMRERAKIGIHEEVEARKQREELVMRLAEESWTAEDEIREAKMREQRRLMQERVAAKEEEELRSAVARRFELKELEGELKRKQIERERALRQAEEEEALVSGGLLEEEIKKMESRRRAKHANYHAFIRHSLDEVEAADKDRVQAIGRERQRSQQQEKRMQTVQSELDEKAVDTAWYADVASKLKDDKLHAVIHDDWAVNVMGRLRSSHGPSADHPGDASPWYPVPPTATTTATAQGVREPNVVPDKPSETDRPSAVHPSTTAPHGVYLDPVVTPESHALPFPTGARALQEGDTPAAAALHPRDAEEGLEGSRLPSSLTPQAPMPSTTSHKLLIATTHPPLSTNLGPRSDEAGTYSRSPNFASENQAATESQSRTGVSHGVAPASIEHATGNVDVVENATVHPTGASATVAGIHDHVLERLRAERAKYLGRTTGHASLSAEAVGLATSGSRSERRTYESVIHRSDSNSSIESNGTPRPTESFDPVGVVSASSSLGSSPRSSPSSPSTEATPDRDSTARSRPYYGHGLGSMTTNHIDSIVGVQGSIRGTYVPEISHTMSASGLSTYRRDSDANISGSTLTSRASRRSDESDNGDSVLTPSLSSPATDLTNREAHDAGSSNMSPSSIRTESLRSGI
eukprot:Rmarinus@m.190